MKAAREATMLDKVIRPKGFINIREEIEEKLCKYPLAG